MSAGWQSLLLSPISNCLPKSSSADYAWLTPNPIPRVLEKTTCVSVHFSLCMSGWHLTDDGQCWRRYHQCLLQIPSWMYSLSSLQVETHSNFHKRQQQGTHSPNESQVCVCWIGDFWKTDSPRKEPCKLWGKSETNGWTKRWFAWLEGYDCTWQPLYCGQEDLSSINPKTRLPKGYLKKKRLNGFPQVKLPTRIELSSLPTMQQSTYIQWLLNMSMSFTLIKAFSISSVLHTWLLKITLGPCLLISVLHVE